MTKLSDPQQLKKLLRDGKQSRRSTALPPKEKPLTPRTALDNDDTMSPLLVARQRITELELESASLRHSLDSLHSLLLRHEARFDKLQSELVAEREQIHIAVLTPSEVR